MTTPTCPNCGRIIGPKGHRCRRVTNPARTTRPADFAAQVRAARIAATYRQTSLDLDGVTE